MDINKCTIITVCEEKRPEKETNKNYTDKAIRLVRSLRKYGGACKDFPVNVWVSSDKCPQEDVLNSLSMLGCSFTYGDCECLEHPVFNKISAMNTPVDTEYALWLDTDIMILKDFSEVLDLYAAEVSAPDVCYSYHTWASEKDNDTWEKMYSLVGVDWPGPKIITSIDNKPSNFYLCSGMVLFKTDIGFPQVYKEIANTLIKSDIHNVLESFSQTALSLAILKGKYDYKVLPEKHHLVYALRGRIFEDSTIVHYQDCLMKEISKEDWDVPVFQQ